MILADNQLRALVAVIEEGSFERSAHRLNVTASAISQRIKLLEEQVGTVLVVRAAPCRPTAVGEAVYRHALQVKVLESDLLRDISPALAGPHRRLPLAVNADSLSTWLPAALQDVASSLDVQLDVRVDDENRTAEWLRSGSVLGAVTAEAQVVKGCQSRPIGAMRYRAAASPALLKPRRRAKDTLRAWGKAPVLCFSDHDRLVEAFLAAQLGEPPPRLMRHHLPSPEAIVRGCISGLGWALHPEPLVEQLIEEGRLVEPVAGAAVDIPLYWQHWSLSSPSLTELTARIEHHARAVLHGREGALGLRARASPDA